ncbi:MAG: outer membrane protein heavy metal efflux system, partial [Bryobacterales bacterium]|nr:outer membrane protein heavy metal efflux system [Bryobacterales bacterium]
MRVRILPRAGVFLLSVAATRLSAAAPLGPEEAVAEALRSNQALVAAKARIGAAEGQKEQAGLKPNPRLVLQSENARVGSSRPFQYSRDADTFAYASQVFERGGKRERRIELAQQNVRGTEVSQEALQNQIAARVLTSYWTVLGSQQIEAALAESVENLGRTVQYHRDRVREGSLPEGDLIRIQLEYEQVVINYQNAKQDS